MLDDEYIEMLKRDFITYYQETDYYGLGLKLFTRMEHEAVAVYKIGKKVLIRRDLFDEYLRLQQRKNDFNLNESTEDLVSEEEETMRQGVLVLDFQSGRLDIRFGLDEYYGGLHCRTAMDVCIDGQLIPTRIEMGED